MFYSYYCIIQINTLSYSASIKCFLLEMWSCQQNSPEEEAELKKIKDIEKSVDLTAKKLEKVDEELTGLKNVMNIVDNV